MKTILSPFISILLFTHIYSETLKDTQPNKIPLLKDENGYYVNIVLTNSTTDFSKEVPMMVDLCTSYTIFGSNCLNFTSYDCEEFSCEPLTGLIRSGAFDMTFDSNLIAANISLGADNWTPNWTLLANVCSSTDEGYGKSRYGLLGLGLQSPIERQEISMPPIYSVYINQNNTHGDIVFGFDQKYAKTTSPLATVYFENSFVTYVYLGKRIIAEIVDITFDMNADALYMDSNTLQTFIFSLADYNITCSSETTDRPVCNGTIKDYPSLYVTDFRYSFAITPEIYILRNSQDNTAGTVVLNIKILGESKRKQSSVGDLIGEIIFGSDFMSSYYLVFNSTETDTSVSLYPAQHGIQDIETTEVHEQRYVAPERTLLDVESQNQPSLLSKHIRYRL